MPVVVFEEGTAGLSGKIRARFDHMADEVMEGKDGYPPALRANFKADNGDILYLAVPLDHSAGERLTGFISEAPHQIPTEQAGLRSFLERELIHDEIWVKVRHNRIMARLAPAGKHRFRLHLLHKFFREDGSTRMGFNLRTEDGLETSFYAPWPKIVTMKGESPDMDKIDMKTVGTAVQYLVQLGLDLEKLEREMRTAAALWPGHYGSGLEPVPSFFADMNDITPELLEAVQRHGPQQVELEIEVHPKYGLGPKRIGRFLAVKMAQVVLNAQVAAEEQDFGREALRFAESWENLTTILTGRDDSQFTSSSTGKLTDSGRDVANMVLLPVVEAFPSMVKATKADGTPAIHIPPQPEHWHLKGLSCASLLAERLRQSHIAGDTDLTDFSGVVDSKDPSKIVRWAREHVPELTAEISPDHTTEVL